MKILPVVFALFVGCRDASKDLQALADRACACNDKACAEAVVDDLVALAREHKTARGNEGRAAKAAGQMMQCAVKAGADAGELAAKLEAARR